MNITLSIDDHLVERAREVARQQGTSLNELIRHFLGMLVGQSSSADLVAELQRLWNEDPGHSAGYRFRREDAYEERP